MTEIVPVCAYDLWGAYLAGVMSATGFLTVIGLVWAWVKLHDG